MKVLMSLLLLTVTLHGILVGVTAWWTLTGHCCGSPLVGSDWDDCLPASDQRGIFLGDTVCDRETWKRRKEHYPSERAALVTAERRR